MNRHEGIEPSSRPLAQDLRPTLVIVQVSATIALATCLALAPRILLTLPGEVALQAAKYVFVLSLMAGAASAAYDWLDTRRLTFLLRALEAGDQTLVDHSDVLSLNRQARRSSVIWLFAQLCALAPFATPFRPSVMDAITGVSLMLLSASIAATAALGLYSMLRRIFLRSMELVSPRLMAEVVLANEALPETRNRISRRLLIAVTMPMLFVALGSALIANAHVRRADESGREQLARLLAGVMFESTPETAQDIGLQGLYTAATELGFATRVLDGERAYSVRRMSGGKIELTTPLEGHSAITQFEGSTVDVLSIESLVFLALALCSAAALGLALGNALSRDLHTATRAVQHLGARGLLDRSEAKESVARFRIVHDLQRSIERVAERFRLFAMAQADAIEARSAATRMRGQFFATVSHDLRSPLNSILGFTELVRMDHLTEGQAESLKVIADRGQELLTLIETILDAARVEVGQLSLMFDAVVFEQLLGDALDKAERLSGGSPLRIYKDIAPTLPPVLVDRVRGSRALAAFIAYSVRATSGAKMWIRAEQQDTHTIRIDVDVPATLHTADELRQLLDSTGGLSKREHRGLTLALQLANSVVRLHHGFVHVVDRGLKGSMFCITLPIALEPTAIHSASPRSDSGRGRVKTDPGEGKRERSRSEPGEASARPSSVPGRRSSPPEDPTEEPTRRSRGSS